MKKVFLTLSVSTLVLFSPDSWGMFKGSYGGDVLICKGGENRLLEYYEAELLQGNSPDFGSARTYSEILNILISRLQKHFPVEAAKVVQELQVFETDVRFIQDSELVGSNELLDLPIKNDCGFKKVVIEIAKQFPEDKSYLVQKDYWDILTPEAKAGLVFQTVLFKTIPDPQFDKNPTASFRLLNASLAGGRSYPLLRTARDWGNLLTRLGLPHYYYLYDGHFDLNQSRNMSPIERPLFYSNGLISRAQVRSTGEFPVNFFGRKLQAEARDGQVFFSRRGKIIGFTPSFQAKHAEQFGFMKLPHRNIDIFYTDETESFYGYYLRSRGYGDSSEMRARANGYRCPYTISIEFYLNGKLRSINCGIPMKAKFKGQKVVARYLKFSKQGVLEDAQEKAPINVPLPTREVIN